MSVAQQVNPRGPSILSISSVALREKTSRRATFSDQPALAEGWPRKVFWGSADFAFAALRIAMSGEIHRGC
jgi:hypothetical protein